MKRFKSYKIISLLSTLVFLGGIKIVNADIFPSWEGIKMFLGNTILFLASQVLRIAGLLFNCVMDYTIHFSDLVSNTGVVNIGWEIFRDISNMVFIFILLIISIATILGIQNYGAKNLLKNVIIIALLINFSLFATKVIIDAANVFTVGFYNATIKNAGVASASAVGGADYNKGITAIFAGALNLHTIYKADEISGNSKDSAGTTINAKNILTVALMGSVLLVITAFVFFAASVLLMKRIVILMFLMMISPLAFLGMILPATSGYSKQWWTTLFKEAFYAPIFMMFIYVVALAINTPEFRDNISKSTVVAKKGFANLATGGDTMLVIFNFILIIGLMLASIITASKLGANGASGMMNMGKKLNKWGQGKIKAGAGAATFGAGGRLARRAIGGYAQRAADKMEGTDYAKTARGKLRLKTLRKVGDSSFDVRNTGAGKVMGLGGGIKGGYKTKRDNAKKAETAYAKSLKGDTQAKDAKGNLKFTGEGVDRKPVMISRTQAFAETAYAKSFKNTKTQAKDAEGNLKFTGEGVDRKPVMIKENKNIFLRMVTEPTVAGQKNAAGALIKEYAQKKELKEAQAKLLNNPDIKNARKALREARDLLKDIREIEKRAPTPTERQNVYKEEDKIKELETQFREEIDVIREKIKAGAGKAKADTKPKR